MHAVVAFPGHLCNERIFAPLLAGLADMARLHVPDLYCDDSVGAIARGALVRSPATFTLLAHSMGGAVAFEVLRRAPQRVASLVLIGTTARPELYGQSERRSRATRLVRTQDWRALAELYAPVFFHGRNRRHDPKLDETLEAMIRGLDPAGIRRQQAAFASRADSRRDLAEIRCPTLVICGRQDAITPLSHSEELAGAIPRAELTVIEDCGHVPMLERPDQTLVVMRDWLMRH